MTELLKQLVKQKDYEFCFYCIFLKNKKKNCVLFFFFFFFSMNDNAPRMFYEIYTCA